MVIKGLNKLIKDLTPQALHEENDWGAFRGKVVAVDASTIVFKKLLPWEKPSKTGGGETVHLRGVFYATIRLLQHGVKPVYVFDGVAAKRHSDLANRIAKKYADDRLGPPGMEAKHFGLIAEAIEAIEQHKIVDSGYKNPVIEVKELLRLMGTPYMEAPTEAESQCAELVKSGKADAAVSKNLDTLTYGANNVIRRLAFKKKKENSIESIDLLTILKGLEINYTEFVDLCILLGCEYCDAIKNIKPKRVLELLQKYRSVEEVLRNLDQEKYKIPFFWTTFYPTYDDAREKFLSPSVYVGKTLGFEWRKPDREGVLEYLCGPNPINKSKTSRRVNELFDGLV